MGSAESTGRNSGGSTSTSYAPPRRFKLKTDGSCLPDHEDAGKHGGIDPDDDVKRGPSGYAGVLEDDGGNLVRGFRGFIGVSDCFTAEVHGILKGLEFLDKLGCKDSILENDSEAAVRWVTRQKDDRGKSVVVRDCWYLIERSRQLVHKNNITVRHCSGKVNKQADKLATIAIKKREAYVEFTDVDREINSAGHSSSTENNNTPNLGAAVLAIGTAAVAVWGVSRMLSGDDKVKDEIQGAFRSLGFQPNSSGSTSTSSAPPRGFKLNTDASCLPDHDDVKRGPSGYAGVLEDGSGNLVGGFRGFIGVSDSLTAEIYGILKGLEFLDKHGYKDSILENDAEQAVGWVTDEKKDDPGKSVVVGNCWDLIDKSRRLVRKNNITVRHCYRKVNKHADKLATIAREKREAYVEFTDVYGEINSAGHSSSFYR